MPETRRGFLKKFCSAAGPTMVISSALYCGHGMLKRPAANYSPGRKATSGTGSFVIRPPGAVAESAFLAACIRCYRCQDACDIGAIQFFTESDGNCYHTPYIDPSIKACNTCMKCTTSCPTAALIPMHANDRERADMASVALRKELCLSYKAKAIRNEQALLMEMGREPTESQAMQERRGPCGECYMFCPVRDRAIQLEPGSFLAPIVFTEHCIGCGMCEEICRVLLHGAPAIRVVPTRRRV